MRVGIFEALKRSEGLFIQLISLRQSGLPFCVSIRFENQAMFFNELLVGESTSV